MHQKRQHKTLLKPFLPMALAALLQLSLYSSCQPAQSDIRSEQDIENFFNTANEILKTDSATIAFCDSVINNTTDSVAYYDYSLLKALSNVLSFKAGEMLPITERAAGYASRIEDTPYSRGIKGISLSIEALHYFMLRNDTAITLNQASYDMLMQSDMNIIAADVAANLADAYINAGNMPEGAHWYRRALFLADSLGIQTGHSGRLYSGLARIYSYMLDYDGALELFEKVEPYFNDMTLSMQSHYLHYHGRCYIYMHDYANALKTFNRQKQLLTSHGMDNFPDMFLCKLNLAEIHLNLNNTDSAEIYVREAEPFFRQFNISHGIYYCNSVKIGIATARRNYATVARITGSESVDMREVSRRMENMRSRYIEEYYRAAGQYRKAYDQLAKNTRLNDSLKVSLTQMRTAEIIARFTEDTLKLRHHIALHEKDKTMNRHATLMWALLIVTISLLAAITFLVSRHRRRLLQSKIEMLTLRLNNSRQRISPHFIFNLLNSRMRGAGKEESDTLLKLAKLIRRNLDLTTKGRVSLYEELEFIRRYVSLESLLLGDDFHFTTNIPPREQMQQRQVPAMIVQILVENAIKHGLRPLTEGPRKLTLNVSITDTATTIDVIDNGHGFDIRSIEGESTKNGLHIVRQTISLINQRNKPANHMRHTIANITDENGKVIGCKSSLYIPRATRIK